MNALLVNSEMVMHKFCTENRDYSMISFVSTTEKAEVDTRVAYWIKKLQILKNSAPY